MLSTFTQVILSGTQRRSLDNALMDRVRLLRAARQEDLTPPPKSGSWIFCGLRGALEETRARRRGRKIDRISCSRPNPLAMLAITRLGSKEYNT